jgi:hypothetical protein
MVKEAASMGNIVVNSSGADQGREIKTVTCYLLIMLLLMG